eukprot:7910874-Lingulodinium_polyedra.AAC.1
MPDGSVPEDARPTRVDHPQSLSTFLWPFVFCSMAGVRCRSGHAWCSWAAWCSTYVRLRFDLNDGVRRSGRA